MKYNFLFLVICLLSSCFKKAEMQLFKIEEDDKVGFIDSTGKVVIPSIFIVAGDFSEGLSNARLNGHYGFIDNSGEFVIEAKYDHAYQFSEGLALVYNNGKPGFIGHDGEKVFEINFWRAESFKNGKAKVTSKSGKFGAIDKKGKLIVDTIFSSIEWQENGNALVESIPETSDSNYNSKDSGNKIGVLDSLGNFIIPFWKFESINVFSSDYYICNEQIKFDSVNGETEYEKQVLDKNGKYKHPFKLSDDGRYFGTASCGLLKVSLDFPNRNPYDFPYESYYGFVDINAKIVINNSAYSEASDFNDNRAFVAYQDSFFKIINTNGNLISDMYFESYFNNGFKNGLAFVRKNNKWGLIDTNGHFIIKPKFFGISDQGLIENYFFYLKNDPSILDQDNHSYGIAFINGEIINTPDSLYIYPDEKFNYNLLFCSIRNKGSYINKKGQIVWQEKVKEKDYIEALNIDYKLRSRLYVRSFPIYPFDNLKDSFSTYSPKRIIPNFNFPTNNISIIVHPDLPDTTLPTDADPSRILGFKAYLANTTKQDIHFNTLDGCLYGRIQALNKEGIWLPITYLGSTGCGNSFYSQMLNKNHYWELIIPKFIGEFKTKLRVELKYIKPNQEKNIYRLDNEIFIYSNEFEGSINPGQLWFYYNYDWGIFTEPFRGM